MKKIAWIAPDPLEGSGGHRTIYQNADYLARNGYEVDVYVEKNDRINTDDIALKMVTEYFGELATNIYCGYDLRQKYDLIFATAWFTADFVRDTDMALKKAYFIQDYEALFSPMGDRYIFAENTYRYGLMPVTIGKWLTNKMMNDFNTQSNYFDFCADLDVYKSLDGIEKENAICFIYQPEKPRRCSKLGLEALKIVKEKMPEVKIYLYGSNRTKNIDVEHEHLGLISIEECNELYNKCKVGLCISTSNPSRIPFEMMASGLPVVDMYMENNLFDLPEQGVSLAQTTPESIAKAIIDILINEDKAHAMSISGKKYMCNKSIEVGFKQFADIVEMLLDIEPYVSKKNVDKIYSLPPVIG